MDPQSYGSSPTIVVGGSPGLVVMAGDSCSEGHGFKSQHGWTFFHINLLLKHVRFVRKRPQKEAGDDPFKKAIAFCLFTFVGKEARLDSAWVAVVRKFISEIKERARVATSTRTSSETTIDFSVDLLTFLTILEP